MVAFQNYFSAGQRIKKFKILKTLLKIHAP